MDCGTKQVFGFDTILHVRWGRIFLRFSLSNVLATQVVCLFWRRWFYTLHSPSLVAFQAGNLIGRCICERAYQDDHLWLPLPTYTPSRYRPSATSPSFPRRRPNKKCVKLLCYPVSTVKCIPCHVALLHSVQLFIHEPRQIVGIQIHVELDGRMSKAKSIW